jgi:hypothetical protein
MTLLALGRVALAQPDPQTPPPPDDATTPAEPVTPPAPTPTPPAPVPAPVLVPHPVYLSPNDGPPPSAPDPDRGFRFGSYGRVIAGTDLRGGKPAATNVVAHGPRIVEPSYLELDLSYGLETRRGLKIRPVITLAFDGTLFHDTGEFDARPALRNLFLEAQASQHLVAWAGSRMYRGDDIYLLDYWPLDDQNTVGAGLIYRKPFTRHVRDYKLEDVLELAMHAGINRLNHPFQFQEIEVANPEQGATTVVQLNRQRMIASASASYLLARPANDVSTKLKVHGEVHGLPSGTRKRDDGTLEALPSDTGYLLGAELSFFGWSFTGFQHRHLNLYLRYAKGLAAFDELAPPTSFGPDLETNRASELTFGASGNWETSFGNVMLGALSRRFIDADESTVDPDDGWEYAIDVRPLARVLPDVFVGAELSYQARFPHGLNVNTLRAEDPAIAQIAPMLVYSPMGPSSYDRPQLRLVYRAAHLNEGALDQYVPDDPRHEHAWVHFLGVEAEWWFNSETYR